MAAAEETKPTRQTSIILPLDVDDEIKRFQAEDMRPTWNNAVLALIVEGLEARRRKKPLRALRSADPEPAA